MSYYPVGSHGAPFALPPYADTVVGGDGGGAGGAGPAPVIYDAVDLWPVTSSIAAPIDLVVPQNRWAVVRFRLWRTSRRRGSVPLSPGVSTLIFPWSIEYSTPLVDGVRGVELRFWCPEAGRSLVYQQKIDVWTLTVRVVSR